MRYVIRTNGRRAGPKSEECDDIRAGMEAHTWVMSYTMTAAFEFLKYIGARDL